MCGWLVLTAQAQKQFSLTSPDGKLNTTVTVGEKLTYDITCNGVQILAASPLSMTLEDGTVWGNAPRLAGSSRKNVDRMIDSPFYRSSQLRDSHNSLTLSFKKGWSVEFRAYNDGVAYRFASQLKKPVTILQEEVDYRFPADWTATVPYVVPRSDDPFYSAFENTYVTEPLSKLNKEKLMFLPLVVDAGEGIKLCITESDLENFPGLYLSSGKGENSLTGVHAPFPKKMLQGGHNNLQMIIKEREDFIAKVQGTRTFPWRMSIVTTDDKELASSNMTYLLGSPSRVADLSWIKPGKVAWEWWSDWNIDGVDFPTGVNNNTYKTYIDFAAANHLEYVLLDEGWAVNLQADLMQVVKEIDLQELIDYATGKNVGVLLWAGYYAFDRDMENLCRHYAGMGVKGFKVDFMDRDDQEMVAFNYRAAETCAKYKLLLDLHGMYKPSGLNRTYPNVLNFEGVHGLENMKWSPESVDQVKYDVMIPFIRQAAGPMDYTQGAMRNAAKGSFFPCNSEPMSQGTRCRQLALYVVLDSPLNMLCDTPSNYARETECADFITGIPTVWDETRILDAKLGEYILVARRKGATWYIGGITDWTARDIELDCYFLGDKEYQGEVIKDGVNSHRIGRDFKREAVSLDGRTKVKLHLAPGGGFVMKVQ